MRGRVALDHVAFGVSSLEKYAVPFLRFLGARPKKGGVTESFRGGQWILRNGAVVEFLEPLQREQDNFLHRFIERTPNKNAGLHHLTFTCDDLPCLREKAEKGGFEIIGYSEAKPHWHEFFLHPKQTFGIVIQCVQSDPSKAKSGAWSRDWDFFGEYPDLNESSIAHDVSGISLYANQRDTRRLFGNILDADVIDIGHRIVCKWQNSPLHLDVVHPNATHKNRAVAQGELGSTRGLRFVQISCNGDIKQERKDIKKLCQEISTPVRIV